MKYIIFNKFVNNKTIQFFYRPPAPSQATRLRRGDPTAMPLPSYEGLSRFPTFFCAFRAGVGVEDAMIVDINISIVVHVHHHE